MNTNPPIRNLGCDVTIIYKEGRAEQHYNITEIHYNYRATTNKQIQIAFESDIHSTGCTWPISKIKEFESVPSTEKSVVPSVAFERRYRSVRDFHNNKPII